MKPARQRTRLRAAAAVLLLGSALPALAGPTGEPGPELRARLAAAFQKGDGFQDRFVAEVWLTDMSTRLKRYFPKAMPEKADRIEFLRRVHAEAARAKVSPELVLAVIQVESGFDRFAVSKSGAIGLMQIMPFWLQDIGQPGDNLLHVETNLRMGCTILRYYLDKEHDSYVRALALYNGSSGRADYPYLVLTALNKHWSP